MTLAKLQVPTQRNLVKKDEDDNGKEDSVKELEDGSVQITVLTTPQSSSKSTLELQ